jgi:hypothetical protein
MKWPWLCGLLVLMLGRAALGTDAGYTNDAYVYYTGVRSSSTPSDFNPMIDAFNFVNNNWFIMANGDTYQTGNTTNFINNDVMESYGFWFDRHTTNTFPDSWASSFYNPGQIYCTEILKVWATNIVNPGALTVGDSQNGLMQLVGKNVDLTRAAISMPGIGSSGQIFYFYPTVGTISNLWTPSYNLDSAMPYPFTPYFVVPPFGYFYLQLNNPVVYAHDTGMVNSNRMVQVVYIDQPNPAIANNVSFDPLNGITVQFSGSYVDPMTALPIPSYLVIFDSFGERTNLSVVGFPPYSHPINYSLYESSSPAIVGPPPPAGLPSGIFGNNSITNPFTFVLAQLSATTVSTNNIANGAITNLPGRIQITAGSDLDLTLANISGVNYMALTSTNQFEGNEGASIVSPFSDINLGVTNGYLTVSNLLAPFIPVWAGEVYLWSAKWQIVNNGLTNNFHVLFVSSPSLSAASSAQVQDLILHGTNSIIISDVLNVMRKLSIDAQNLTLTTNGYGNGATSPDGELNLQSPNILWQSSLPNLRWLTNNGAISTMNLALFGSETPTYTTNTTPAIAATGTLSEMNTNGNVLPTNRVTIGIHTYVFVNNITNTVPNQVKIAATFDGSMSNLIAAINHAAGSGTNYSTNTPANLLASAGLLINHSFTVTATTAGSAGNSIVTTNSTSTTNLTWNGHTTLSGGVDAVTNVVMVGGPYGAFVNRGRVSNSGGSTIWARDFESSGPFYSGSGSFILQCLTATLTNGSIVAAANVTIGADSLVTSNLVLFAGAALNLTVTNLLTDTGVTNGNYWYVGSRAPSASPGSYFINGFNLPIKPPTGDLLGTTVFSTAPSQSVIGGVTNNSVAINNLWAGRDYGVSNSGYTNNEAVGLLVLDAQGRSSTFKFYGAGTSNALYVDELEVLDYASWTNHNGPNLRGLFFNTNLVIYYAQAISVFGGSIVSVAEKLNGANTNHLRWMWTYAGHFSSTNIVYPDGTTNTFNAALAQSPNYDSDGDGTVNRDDPTPFFVPSEVALTVVVSNIPPLTALISWHSIPNATNRVFYTTNLITPNWTILTNFISPTNVPPVGGWPITNLVSDPVNLALPRYYQVVVDPWLTYQP